MNELFDQLTKLSNEVTGRPSVSIKLLQQEDDLEPRLELQFDWDNDFHTRYEFSKAQLERGRVPPLDYIAAEASHRFEQVIKD